MAWLTVARQLKKERCAWLWNDWHGLDKNSWPEPQSRPRILSHDWHCRDTQNKQTIQFVCFLLLSCFWYQIDFETEFHFFSIHFSMNSCCLHNKMNLSLKVPFFITGPHSKTKAFSITRYNKTTYECCPLCSLWSLGSSLIRITLAIGKITQNLLLFCLSHPAQQINIDFF